MNRLRDDVGEDPVAERGIAMLRAIGATPPMPELKRKVWGAIQQRRLRAPAPRPLRRLRTAAVVAIVLCLAGTAGAVLSQRWIKLGRAPLAERPTATYPTPAHARTRVAAQAAQNSAQVVAPTVAPTMEGTLPAGDTRASAVGIAPPAAVPAVPTASPRPFAHPAKKVARKAAQAGALSSAPIARPEVRADVSAASARERAEVLDALVALRRDRDPERAGRLLNGYLDAHPQGVLREEAMALGIEAAAARGDAGAAQRLARAYQAAYPSGRFGAFARQHATDATHD